jgi:hypothetical protein
MKSVVWAPRPKTVPEFLKGDRNKHTALKNGEWQGRKRRLYEDEEQGKELGSNGATNS